MLKREHPISANGIKSDKKGRAISWCARIWKQLIFTVRKSFLRWPQ